MMHIISLGAGVQSSTMALMAAHGEITPMPDCAIFADTKWEPKAVYEWLAWLETKLPFPVHRVSAGDIRADALAKVNTTGGRFAAVPWFTQSPTGKRGMGRRQCTKEYKLRPIQKKIVEILGGRPRAGATIWIGISTDEAHRMKPSKVGYIRNSFPLIEAGVSRLACLRWMKDRGYMKPPRSSCIGCPFHSDSEWKSLSDDEFADAVNVDRAIRNPGRGMVQQQFMHRSCVPLDEVDMRSLSDAGQADMFGDECEGLCGN